MLKVAKSGVDIGIVVRDIAAQTRFYSGTLGLPKSGEVPLPNGTLHIFSCGSSLLKLYEIAAAKTAPSAEFGAQTGIAYVTLNVENIDALMDAVKRDGATILTPLSEFDAGVTLPEPVGRVKARYAMLADPEGNRVELLQRR